MASATVAVGGSYKHKETTLKNAPSDGISAVLFGSNSNNYLLASSWDSTLRLYDAVNNEAKGTFTGKAALLDCCFHGDTKAFTGGLDKTVKSVDFAVTSADTGVQETVLGSHAAAVKAVCWAAESSQLFSGSWDSTVMAWDPRAQVALTQTMDLPGKVFSMSTAGTKLVVATSKRQVVVYDTRQLKEPLQRRESSLKYQTRCVRAFPDGTGYVLSSIEGRVAVEYIDMSPQAQASKYAFKCHRQGETVYPVNAMAFHPTHGTFATGGCDNVVNIWDGQNKKRLSTFTGYPSGISSLAFNYDGTLLAVASSYTFEEGEKDHSEDQIFIREINDSEVRKRARKAA